MSAARAQNQKEVTIRARDRWPLDNASEPGTVAGMADANPDAWTCTPSNRDGLIVPHRHAMTASPDADSAATNRQLGNPKRDHGGQRTSAAKYAGSGAEIVIVPWCETGLVTRAMAAIFGVGAWRWGIGDLNRLSIAGAGNEATCHSVMEPRGAPQASGISTRRSGCPSGARCYDARPISAATTAFTVAGQWQSREDTATQSGCGASPPADHPAG